MKKTLKIFSILTIFCFAFAQIAVASSDESPTAAPSNNIINEKIGEQINELKDKIASNVSKLNLVEKRGTIGVITELSASKITLKDQNGNSKFVDVDEITKFTSPDEDSFGFSDLKKGMSVRALGLFNKQTKRLLARFVDVTVDPTFVRGTITDIDSKNFIITLAKEDGKTIKLDIVTSTDIASYLINDDELEDIGFSDVEVGNRLTAIGFPDKDDASLLVSDRVTIFSDVPANPLINISIPEPSIEPTKPIKVSTPVPTKIP